MPAEFSAILNLPVPHTGVYYKVVRTDSMLTVRRCGVILKQQCRGAVKSLREADLAAGGGLPLRNSLFVYGKFN